MNISKKKLEEIDSIPDEDIDLSDIPELDESFWKKAKLRMPLRKEAISFRVDQDVLDWFRSQGKGYQTHMNAVLRTYMEAHQK